MTFKSELESVPIEAAETLAVGHECLQVVAVAHTAIGEALEAPELVGPRLQERGLLVARDEQVEVVLVVAVARRGGSARLAGRLRTPADHVFAEHAVPDDAHDQHVQHPDRAEAQPRATPAALLLRRAYAHTSKWQCFTCSK